MSEVVEQQQLQNGGAGAAEWAIDRAGGIGEQHAVSQIDNTIALKGGRRRRGKKSTKRGGRGRQRGGKSRKNTSRRRRGTRRH